jgi:hypothetical protein
MIKKGEWVRIHKIILQPHERAPQIPDETKKHPLEMWVKGYLDADANTGDEVSITTAAGRKETGKLIEVNPHYEHSFGKFVPELLTIDRQVREILFGGDE